jgi:hypothetical protein
MAPSTLKYVFDKTIFSKSSSNEKSIVSHSSEMNMPKLLYVPGSNKNAYIVYLFLFSSSSPFFLAAAFFAFSILPTAASAPIPPKTSPTPSHCMPVIS